MLKRLKHYFMKISDLTIRNIEDYRASHKIHKIQKSLVKYLKYLKKLKYIFKKLKS